MMTPILPHTHTLIPYGRQSIDERDVAAVVEALRSDWLTQGPRVAEFEQAFARQAGAEHAVAVNSGTAALHAAMVALGVGPGDEVIVPPITFAATANAAVFQGATPVFADVLPDSLLIDPAQVACRITPRTRAVVAVDYAGLPCDYDALREVTRPRGVALVADACHALGGRYRGRPVGALADLSCFSFHPVKHIATGEGGMITTDHAGHARVMREFRTHGVTRDPARLRGAGSGPPPAHYYEMQFLGYNYRLPDLNAALGLSQLGKLERFVARRREIAARYHAAFAPLAPRLRPLASDLRVAAGLPPAAYPCVHAYHLYAVQIDFPGIGKTRAEVVQALQQLGIGTQVHYIPVHLHPFYRERFGYGPGLCPVAEAAYERLLSLPLYPALTDADAERVAAAVRAEVAP